MERSTGRGGAGESLAAADEVTTTQAPPVGRRPSALAMAWVVVADYAYAAVWHTRALVARDVPKQYAHGDRSRPAVILIPGVYETWMFLKPVADRLNADGYRIRVARGLGYNRRPIRDTSARLARALGRLSANPAGSIVVAHSKGGLIGKDLLVTGRGHSGIRGVVAVCSPFAGSRLARYVLDPSLREFDPHDETIVALSGESGVNADIVSIYGVFDPHVPEGSVLHGATNVLLPVSGHFRILGRPELVDAVQLAVDGFSDADAAAAAANAR
ncbi:esterase/lipase family protein [Plantibacter sp. Mn2098]|uniref:esterase/lipase family protein n=1 Tax=Plantibacter sp. Mn2098 TaxID=3395266 RepID=UPI003BED2CF8